jgi:hypothetical protein
MLNTVNTGCFKKSFTTLKAEVNLGVFFYILTVQNVVYGLCNNFLTEYHVVKLFLKHLGPPWTLDPELSPLCHPEEGIKKRGRNGTR